MASSKKHRGLGRGLDALIPAAEPVESDENAKGAVGNHAGADGANDIGSDSDRYHSEKISDGVQRTAGPGEDQLSGPVQLVRITLVEPDRSQPRKNFDQEKLQNLADSIRSKGLLEPIIVQDKGDHYEIIAGERRWRACKIAGLTKIPVIIKSYDDLERVEVSLIENIQREDLNPIEEAKAYERLIDQFHLKQEDIAEKVSKSRTSITNSLRLLKLSDPVQNMVIDGTLSMGQARALISVEDPDQQRDLAKKIAEENLSVREVEKLIRSLSREEKPKKEKTGDPGLEAIYHDLADKMNSALGMKVQIRQKGKKSGSLQIEFSSQEDLEKLMDLLMSVES